jgi:hypothetical protein
LELQGLKARPAAAALLCTALIAVAPACARADSSPGLQTADPAGTPQLVGSQTTPPAGFRLTAAHVAKVAARSPTVIAELRHHPHLVHYEYTKGSSTWQVSWFTPPPKQKELIQVYVSDQTGEVTQAWTGYQVQWTMARGYPGAFGRRVNSLYVWLPLCALFVLPFLPWPFRRRPPWSPAADAAAPAGAVPRRRRPTLLLLDALMMLGFSISLAFFNHGDLGLSVPSMYPFMVYLLARMLLLAFGRGRPREPLAPLIPSQWLAVALVFLVGFRIGLNVTNSNVIDVGYAGVIGADKILHGGPLYGGWPTDNPAGDTYAPFNYDAYVPFRAIFGWSGVWDDLPAAHAAAIAFDLLTMLGLFLLGASIRGPTLGTLMAYAWAAYPFTLFTLESNSNDALVALMIVATLLVIRWAPLRGVVGALAGLTKFAPLALGPLFLRGIGEVPRPKSIIRFVVAYGLTCAALMAPIVLGHNLSAFWKDSISYQATRPAPFSIWGLWGGLGAVQHLIQGAAAGLAILVAIIPSRRGLVELAALGAAVIISLQLGVTYWFYLYITWFTPLVIVALLGAEPRAPEPAAGPGIQLRGVVPDASRTQVA